MQKALSIAIALLLTCTAAQQVWSQVERREQGNLILEDIPTIPASIVERMLQYQEIHSHSLHDWDPAGEGMLTSTRSGETLQVHYVAKPGGARRQLTFFSEPMSAATMHPDPSRRGFLYTKDVGGRESYQIVITQPGTSGSKGASKKTLWRASITLCPCFFMVEM